MVNVVDHSVSVEVAEYETALREGRASEAPDGPIDYELGLALNEARKRVEQEKELTKPLN